MTTNPTLEMLDPATLTVDINVRKDAALTSDFIASIKEHGVMEPVIAHRKDDGTLHVLMGQRRTRAPVEERHFDYLNQLIQWGYTASAVEQIIIDKHTTEGE